MKKRASYRRFAIAATRQNSLLIPCSKAKFTNFGQNSMILASNSRNSLLISLFPGIWTNYHPNPRALDVDGLRAA
jgi:hypothetical protein